MSQPIIVYNKADFQLIKIYKVLLNFYPNVIIIDDYNIYYDDSLYKLSWHLLELKEKHSEIRVVFFIDSERTNINSITQHLVKQNYRMNIVFFNVRYDDDQIENFKKFNELTEGDTIFGWLIGKEDSEGQIINTNKLSEIFFSWVLLLDSGALSFQTDKDIFFQQQNWRTEKNHLFVLKSRILINNFYLKLLDSINYFLKALLKKFNTPRALTEYSDFSNILEIEEENNENFLINSNFYPTYQKLQKLQKFNNISGFEANLKLFLNDISNENIIPQSIEYADKKKIIFKDKFRISVKNTLDSFLTNLKQKYLDKDQFNFTLIANYIDNTIKNLKEKINGLFLFDQTDLHNTIMSVVEKDVENILTIKKSIREWKSINNKKKYVVFSLLSSLILYIISIIMLLLLSISISIGLLGILLTIILFSTATFWIWRFISGLKQLRKERNFKIKKLNRKLKEEIDKSLSALPYQLEEFIKKHFEKKSYNYLYVELTILKNGLNNISIGISKFIEELNLILKEHVLHKDLINVEEDVYKYLFYNITKSYFSNEILNYNDLDIILSENLNVFLDKQQSNKETDFNINYNAFNNEPVPADIKYLTDFYHGVTRPIAKGSGTIIIKPEDHEYSDTNAGKIISIKSDKVLLIGKYYSIILNK